MKKCVYAGSFDPIHNGHVHIIERCSMMFDEVVVALGVNASKKMTFKKEDRLEMLKLATARFRNVTVESFDGYVVDFMKSIGAVYYARGVRNEKDLDYEERTFNFNVERYEDIITLFFPAGKGMEYVSSTEIKELLKNKKSVKKYVPDEVLPYLLKISN